MGNCKHTAGEQKAADITDENDGVVRGAQQVDGNPKGKVRSRARAQNIQEAKNFPHTNAGIDTGMVIIWRMVLVLNSSAQSLIEIPGINSRYSQG